MSRSRTDGPQQVSFSSLNFCVSESALCTWAPHLVCQRQMHCSWFCSAKQLPLPVCKLTASLQIDREIMFSSECLRRQSACVKLAGLSLLSPPPSPISTSILPSMGSNNFTTSPVRL